MPSIDHNYLAWIKVIENVVFIAKIDIRIFLLLRIPSEIKLFPQEVQPFVWRHLLNFLGQFVLIKLFLLGLRLFLLRLLFLAESAESEGFSRIVQSTLQRILVRALE